MTAARTLLLCTILTIPAVAAEAPNRDALAAMAEALRPAMVQVEYTVRFDRDEAPYLMGAAAYQGDYYSPRNLEELIGQERPLVLPGYLVAPDRVFTQDPTLPARFLQQVEVVAGEERVAARVAAFTVQQPGCILALERPLTTATPLPFEPAAGAAEMVICYHESSGEWGITVAPHQPGVTVLGSEVRDGLPRPGIVTTRTGTPLGVLWTVLLPETDDWRGTPLKHELLTDAGMAGRRDQLDRLASRCLRHVQLGFRSPREGAGGGGWGGRFNPYGGNSSETEWDGIGVVLEGGRVLVLAHLDPARTARLERIRVHGARGDVQEATFVATLADHGAFLAQLPEPHGEGIRLASGSLLEHRGKLLLGIRVAIKGETRIASVWHTRVDDFHLGWRRQIYPAIPGEEDDLFLFDLEATRLLALPLQRRQKVTGDRHGWSGRVRTTAACYLHETLAAGEEAFDPSNVPLVEEEEDRLAWLGVELQGLNADLARVNLVSDQTRNGEFGAIVSYVYDGSPAAAQGLRMGDILVRLHVEDYPRPVEVNGQRGYWGFSRPFPWEALDQIPLGDSQHLPLPWPSRETGFAETLTKLGFGTRFTAELFRDGEQLRADFTVEQSPPRYESAPRYTSEPLELTVRDLTYEARRYFQKTAADPGVIISKVEPGSRAAVAGLRPYEVITHINDQPVQTIADFETLVAEGGELRFLVVRLNKGRIVKIQL